MSKLDTLPATEQPPTPRTDAALDELADDQRGAVHYNGGTFIDFASELEREHADIVDDMLRMHNEKMKFFERTIELERELATCRAVTALCCEKNGASRSETRAPQCETRCALLDGDLATQRAIHDGYASSSPSTIDKLTWQEIGQNAGWLPSATVAPDEIKRLREIEHMVWHVLDDSEEDARSGNISIRPGDDYFKLCDLLPEEHPHVE